MGRGSTRRRRGWRTTRPAWSPRALRWPCVPAFAPPPLRGRQVLGRCSARGRSRRRRAWLCVAANCSAAAASCGWLSCSRHCRQLSYPRHCRRLSYPRHCRWPSCPRHYLRQAHRRAPEAWALAASQPRDRAATAAGRATGPRLGEAGRVAGGVGALGPGVRARVGAGVRAEGAARPGSAAVRSAAACSRWAAARRASGGAAGDASQPRLVRGKG